MESKYFKGLSKNPTIPEEQYLLGMCYLEGNGVGRDYGKAVKWLEKAAQGGVAKATYQLGKIYLEGRGVEVDKETAFKCLISAADRDVMEANYELGMHYLKEGNSEEASLRFEKASKLKMEQLKIETCEKGDARAQYHLGKCYAKGDGVEYNPKAAFFWYERAAKQGLPEAQFKLGNMRVEADPREAFRWYEKAAEQGLAEARYALGNCYAKGIGIEADPSEAFGWYEKAAEQGLAEAQYVLGNCYAKGIGVEADPSEAFGWYEKAAEQGLAEAQFAFGNMCLEANPREAFGWYDKAAKKGLAEAQYVLGNCYAKGIGVEANLRKAFLWYEIAAEQGLAEAQYAAGLCCESGDGTAKSLEKAITWYKKAAEQGDSEAQYRFGLICFMTPSKDKLYTAPARKDAVRFLEDAAKSGHAKSQCLLGKYYIYEAVGERKLWQEAFELFWAACKKDVLEAEFQLALCLLEGKGVKANWEAATRHFKQYLQDPKEKPQGREDFIKTCFSAMDGSAEDQYQLYKLYTEGKGIVKNQKSAFRWLSRAAEQNHLQAQFALARCYVKGVGIKKNREAAFAIYKKLAEEGHARVQRLLGMCYKNGYGVLKDEKKWEEWMEKAAANGDEKAKSELQAERERLKERTGALYPENDSFRGWMDPTELK